MAKQTRVFVEGLSVHVIQKGNNGCAIFARDADCEVFLAMARKAATIASVAVHGFVCMRTHFHLLVTPDASGGLPSMMKRLDGSYVRYFNRTYQRTGTLWNGRYRGFLVDNERYCLTCLRYIERNPVNAGIVASPSAYSWSSYAVHAFGRGPDWIAPHSVYYALGDTAEKRQEAYRALCDTPLSEEQAVLVEQGVGI